MTRDEHLYTIAAEECAELAQRFSKANRFGGDEVQPGQGLNNRQGILQEFTDLVSVMTMLGFLTNHNFGALETGIAAKKKKVEKFLRHSAQCSTLEGR